jgi:hypothetical protein
MSDAVRVLRGLRVFLLSFRAAALTVVPPGERGWEIPALPAVLAGSLREPLGRQTACMRCLSRRRQSAPEIVREKSE